MPGPGLDQTGRPRSGTRPGDEGFPLAVENPVDKMWRTGDVLWITSLRAFPPQWDT